MAKRGRKRKEGVKRDTRGRSRGDLPDEARSVVLGQPNRASLPEALRLDQKAESPLGWLNLMNAITNQEYDAGKRYAEVVARYRAAIGIPDPERRPEAGQGSEFTREEVTKRKEAYDNAFDCMGFQAAQKEVAQVAVHERPMTNLKLLRCGLQSLALHFGLTRGRKSVWSGEILSSLTAPRAKVTA